MNGKSWVNLHNLAKELVKNPYKATEPKIEPLILGHCKHAAILDEFSFVNFPTLKECLLPPVITKEEKQNNLLYKRMKEIDDEIWKNRVKKDNDMMYHKEQPDPIQEEPFRNRKARRVRAKELRRKDKKGKKK